MPEVADPDLQKELSALPVPQRAVIVLRVLYDWSQADTAEALGVPIGTVKSRLNRALANLERRING
jgi:RNA polymerase sigma-70 factor (ECF subfamily)